MKNTRINMFAAVTMANGIFETKMILSGEQTTINMNKRKDHPYFCMIHPCESVLLRVR